MKWLKRAVLLLLALGMLIGVAGCTIWFPKPVVSEVPATTKDPVKEAYKSNPANYVEFSRSTEPRVCYVSVPELMEYKTQYSDCNGTWFRDQLSGEELVIYNSYLYALENRFIYFTLYVEDSDKDFSYIRELVSMDSPFLEQNYTHFEYVRKVPINYIGERISVSMEQFTDSRWKMKMEALTKCRQIVQNIPPEYETQEAKMEYLYDYVCNNVEYVEYESMADESYFYDAVCKGQSLCDGYSNMLSLLFRLIGVECCEVIGTSKYEEAGHTWVVANLNGKFYNFDPTFEDTDEMLSKGRKYFGFSDDLLDMPILEHKKMSPRCTDLSRDFAQADITVSSLADWEEVKKIVTLAEERRSRGEDVILIGVRSSVDSGVCDLFFERFFSYTKKEEEISLRYWKIGKGNLVEMTRIPEK